MHRGPWILHRFESFYIPRGGNFFSRLNLCENYSYKLCRIEQFGELKFYRHISHFYFIGARREGGYWFNFSLLECENGSQFNSKQHLEFRLQSSPVKTIKNLGKLMLERSFRREFISTLRENDQNNINWKRLVAIKARPRCVARSSFYSGGCFNYRIIRVYNKSWELF